MKKKISSKTQITQNYKDIVKKLSDNLKGKVAVYIDAANLEKSVQDLGFTPPPFKKGMLWKAGATEWRVDYLKLRRFFAQNCQLRSIGFYTASFGTPNHDGFLTFLKNHGYRLVTKKNKNNFGL